MCERPACSNGRFRPRASAGGGPPGRYSSADAATAGPLFARGPAGELRRRLPTLGTNSHFVPRVWGAPLAVVKQYSENPKNGCAHRFFRLTDALAPGTGAGQATGGESAAGRQVYNALDETLRWVGCCTAAALAEGRKTAQGTLANRVLAMAMCFRSRRFRTRAFQLAGVRWGGERRGSSWSDLRGFSETRC